MPASVDSYEPADELEVVLLDAFRSLRMHQRLYPDSVVPRLAEALRRAGVEPPPKEVVPMA